MVPNLDDMPKLTVAELLEHFDAYLDRVAAGAYYLIIEDDKTPVVLMPYSDFANATDTVTDPEENS